MTRAIKRNDGQSGASANESSSGGTGQLSKTVVDTVWILMGNRRISTVPELSRALVTRFGKEGIKRTALYDRMSGAVPFTTDEIEVLAKFFDVSPLRLLVGIRIDPEVGAFNPPYLRDETTLPDDSASCETIDLREHQPTGPTCVPPSRDPGRTVKRRRTLWRRGTRPTDNRPPREATRNAA